MRRKDRELVQAAVENEGFDYAFVHYSHFDEIKDENFHLLRLQYVEAQQALADYIA